jgi:predicted nucleic acid-binding protein
MFSSRSRLNSHIFHDRVREWFDSLTDSFATCAITEGTLLRVHMRLAVDTSVHAAWALLASIHAMPEHRFWNDGFSYREISENAITGARQVTDAWLAELARRKGGKLATLDAGLASLHRDVGFLLPA